MTVWTTMHTELLSDNIGIMSFNAIAKRIGKTEKAVRNKAYANGMKVYDSFYTARLLASELGVNHRTVMKWYNLGLLPGKRAWWRHGYKQPCMIFREDKDIVPFLMNYYYLFGTRYIKKRLNGVYVPNPYFNRIIERGYGI